MGKVLVTGGAGFIGSVLVARLVEAGHDVVVLDNLSRGRKSLLHPQADFRCGDVMQAEQFISRKDAVETVVHLAGYSAAGEAAQWPELYWRNNTVASLHLLDVMRDLGIKKMLFSSTCLAYGEAKELPLSEMQLEQPDNAYGMTKLSVDMAIRSECEAHGLAASSFRFFNVGGAYRAYGELHDTETRIIPRAFAATTKSELFHLYGDDYDTPDGTCIRDYIHVDDLSDALLLALPKLVPGKHSMYNLGNGTGFSNREVLETVEAVTGLKLRIVMGPRREGDPAVLIASSAKARRELGWQPKKPLLSAIIQDAWDFYCLHH